MEILNLEVPDIAIQAAQEMEVGRQILVVQGRIQEPRQAVPKNRAFPLEAQSEMRDQGNHQTVNNYVAEEET